MYIVFIGPPGAGKGTQAKLLTQAWYNYHAISPGEMLRDPEMLQSEVGQMAQKIMAQGNLLPDDIINNLVRERVRQIDKLYDDSHNLPGLIFDGYPRSIPQAEYLRDMQVLDFVVNITLPEEEIVRRLTGRRIHPASGRTYHIEFNPPKVDGKDDETGEDLIQRADDTPDAIKKRLQVYNAQAQPIIDFYQDLCSYMYTQYYEIDTVGSVEEVFERVKRVLTVF